MKITMVKKILANGDPCKKCGQTEAMLRSRGLWDRLDAVVVADERDERSPGMVLAAKHGVKLAPFFIVENDGEEAVYESSLRFVKAVFPGSKATDAGPATALSDADLAEAAREYQHRPPQDVLRFGLTQFGSRCAIAFSGAEDVVLIDMAVKTGLEFSVFCLDTGRLHPETLRFIERVRTHYGIDIHVAFPNVVGVEALVRKKGLFSFLEDGHTECCSIRKVEPLGRVLSGFDAWITGQRRDQSPATRSDIAVIARDRVHTGRTGPLVKLNPLADTSSRTVWEYITDYEVPYNELHDRGFVSIGCEPCTRAVRPGEHERAGRWWWEDETKRECGLHVER